MKQLKNIKLSILIGMMIPILSYSQVRPDINSFTSGQKTILVNAMMDYITPEIVQYHCDYINQSGGVQTDIHSDFDFLPYHRTYIEGMEDYLLEQGLSNYVYVQVRNRGCVNSSPNANTKLKLYWVKSTTGVVWPDSWIGNITTGGGLPLGGLIGSVTIPVVEAGGSTILEFAWNPVDPSNYPQVSFYQPKDFCLLARIESDYDPMTFPETPEFWINVNNNNNIIWKNIVVLDADPNNIAPGGGTGGSTGNYYGSVYVSNPKPSAEVYSLSFLADNSEIIDYADVTVTMTQELWDIWQTGGGLIDGDIKDISRELNVKKIQILTPNTTLQNLTMPSGGLYPIAIEFNFHTDDFSSLMPEYKYQIQQRYNGTDHIFGTETYIVKTGNRSPISANAGTDQVISQGDNADLSADDVGLDVIYNWYAPDGSLIYTGKDLTVNPDISKKYKLEVISTLDGVKDYDEVEVRVKEFEILNMSPNPASNLVNISYKAINANSAYLMITMAYGSSSNYILDVNQNNTTIDISNYQTGIYNVVLVCNGQAVDVSTLVVQ